MDLIFIKALVKEGLACRHRPRLDHHFLIDCTVVARPRMARRGGQSSLPVQRSYAALLPTSSVLPEMVSPSVMSIYEQFCRKHSPTRANAAQESTKMRTITSDRSRLLDLPPELRGQIFEYIVGSRIVHVRMNWAGIFSPTGYSYSCFTDLHPLLESSTHDLRSRAVPFDTDVTTLTRVCHQLHQDTSLLPFKLWVWAFEDAFTLDQFVTARGLGCIPVHHKNAIRRVAVAPPGHHQSHEKVLQNLQEVLLIGSTLFHEDDLSAEAAGSSPRRSLIRLRRDPLTGTWLRSD